VASAEFERFGELFNAIPSPYMVLDPQLRYVAANPAYCKATGKSLDALLGNCIFDIFPNDGPAGRDLRDSLNRVLRSGKADTLAHIHYAIPNAKGDGFDDRYWTAIHFPIHDEEGTVTHVVQNTVDVTELHRLRRSTFVPFRTVGLETALIRRAQEAEEAQKALLEENNDFRRLFNQAPGMIAVLSGPEHVFTFVNEAYTRFVGRRNLVGKPVRKALPELSGQGFYEMLDSVYQTREPISREAARIVLQQEKGGPESEAFLDFTYHPIFDSADQVTGVFVQGLDRTESVKSARGRELLLRELNHRVKNLFSVAISMVTMTARNASTPKEMAGILTGRLSALSHAHGMVMNDAGSDADGGRIAFHDLVERIMAPHVDAEGSRMKIEGPSIVLGSKAATSMALVIHEMATNAAKYGALSTSEGRISVEWETDDDAFRLNWKETGGPRIRSTPEPSGFGSRLAKISVEGQLGGKLEFAWPPEGAQVAIAFPLKNAAL
jgi:PAS domain S-box-containing protein